MNLIEQAIRSKANPTKSIQLQRYFKTGKGEYGEGDVFLGLTVPQTRAVAKEHWNASFEELDDCLQSPIHELRLAALLVMVEKFQKGNESDRKKWFNYYLSRSKFVNNWDLVDLSAHKIVGEHLLEKNKKILFTLAKSDNVWDRRIAIISTFSFIQRNQFNDSLKIAKMLLNDEHDLIHKAVGWMLREIGKRDRKQLEKFLKQHYQKMPRTMLRYAIEKFPEKKRKAYLNGKI